MKPENIEVFDSAWRAASSVSKCSLADVDVFIKKHYLKCRPAIVLLCLMMRVSGQPAGCVVFSAPPREANVRFGGETWELARLYLIDRLPLNSETWFIAQSINFIRTTHPKVKFLLSYADPSAGHSGVIYRASNWIDNGRTDDERKTPRSDYFDAATGKKYGRRGNIPSGVTVERRPRVSKHRFYYPMERSKRASKNNPTKSLTDKRLSVIVGPRQKNNTSNTTDTMLEETLNKLVVAMCERNVLEKERNALLKEDILLRTEALDKALKNLSAAMDAAETEAETTTVAETPEMTEAPKTTAKRTTKPKAAETPAPAPAPPEVPAAPAAVETQSPVTSSDAPDPAAIHKQMEDLYAAARKSPTYVNDLAKCKEDHIGIIKKHGGQGIKTIPVENLPAALAEFLALQPSDIA